MGRQFIDFWDDFTKIIILNPVSSWCLNFFVDIVGRIKCPAYIGCGGTPTRNTTQVNLTTELEMSICFLLFFFCFFFCVCVYRHFSRINHSIYYSFDNCTGFLPILGLCMNKDSSI